MQGTTRRAASDVYNEWRHIPVQTFIFHALLTQYIIHASPEALLPSNDRESEAQATSSLLTLTHVVRLLVQCFNPAPSLSPHMVVCGPLNNMKHAPEAISHGTGPKGQHHPGCWLDRRSSMLEKCPIRKGGHTVCKQN